MRRPHGIACALSVMVALGCARPTPSAVSADLGSRIAGSWRAELTLDRPPIFVRDKTLSARGLTGEFAFVRAGADRRDRATDASAFGVYDIDFGVLGAPHRREVPSASLYALSPDSIEIRLDHLDAEAFVIFRGKLEGDSILGGWDISIPRVTEGGGKFVMVRKERR